MSESAHMPASSAASLPPRPPGTSSVPGGKNRNVIRPPRQQQQQRAPQPGEGAYLARPPPPPRPRQQQPHLAVRGGPAASRPPRFSQQQQPQLPEGGSGVAQPMDGMRYHQAPNGQGRPPPAGSQPARQRDAQRAQALPSTLDRLQQGAVEHNGFHNVPTQQPNGGLSQQPQKQSRNASGPRNEPRQQNQGKIGRGRRYEQNGTAQSIDPASSSRPPLDRGSPSLINTNTNGRNGNEQAKPLSSTHNRNALNPSAHAFQPAPTTVTLPDQKAEAESAPPARLTGKNTRRAAFHKTSQLSEGNREGAGQPFEIREEPLAPRKAPKKKTIKKEYDTGVKSDDLTSRLIIGLSNKPFLECPICFLSLLPHQQIWSCLPAPITRPAPASRYDKDSPAYAPASEPVPPVQGSCYTPFHLSCIADWASRSLKDAALKDLKEGQVPEWRCPGCQKRRVGPVSGYRCFCDAIPSPKYTANSLLTPHSCGQNCLRRRANCYHGCPLTCHPGPCPPCQIPLIVPCPSHGKPLTVKCSIARAVNAPVPTCESPCLKNKSCGRAAHQCFATCHEGPCAPCDETERVRCYCGTKEIEALCGWNKSQARECVRPSDEPGDLEVEDAWTGRFPCGKPCPRKYDCGIHPCPENCHDHPLEPSICPTSPQVITHCPCGRNDLSDISSTQRSSCLDPIPTCSSPCTKARPCGHVCQLTCHDGECPPCGEEVVRPCRCGEGTVWLPCKDVNERDESGEEITCERVCKALRTCGRHECGRICCPLSYKAKFKGKRRLLDDPLDQPGEDDLQLHACPLACGRPLGCGLHTCSKPDHKGACGRCLEASYEELICHCGHTVVFPPVPCGTSIDCTYPCARPPPACGHPKTLHTCHENDTCPPCPYLRDRECACGKNKAVKNIRCSQERVSCGAVCGTLLDCGFHTCEKSCHSKGDCGECTQVCRKPKRICGHPCQAICHAPARCPENDACSTIVTQTCACGHLQNRGSCGASVSNPISREKVQLKCVNECLLRQRNARLADALGIKPAERNLEEWAPELKAFCSQNHSFVRTVEQTFKDFFASSRQVMVLPHMPPAKRTFVISMADVYRLGRELVDQEPQRSVQIRRRVDTRIPNPLLSDVAPSPAPRPQLGGLANLRQSSASKSSSSLGNLKASATGPLKKPWASGPSTPRVASPVTPAPGSPAAGPVQSTTGTPAALALPVVLPDDENAKDWDLSDAEA